MTPSQRRPLAVGWATVDLDRAAGELASLLIPGSGYEPAAPSLLLGATCRVGRANGAAPAPFVILLEPSTEGPLAAALARHGEGWCARWLAPWDDEAPSAGSAQPASSASPPSSAPSVPPSPGPLGAERLLRDGRRSGPFRLVVDAATIAP